MSSNPTPDPTVRHSGFVIDSGFGFRTSGFVPLPLTLAALTTFAALYLTGGRFPGLFVLAGLLVASHLTAARVPRRAMFRWGLRLVAFTAIAAAIGLPTTDAALWLFEPDYTRLFGTLLAAEFVIRAWTDVEPARVPRARRVMLLITGLVLLAASNTYERPPIHTLVPVYMLFVALSLRSLSIDPTPASAAAAVSTTPSPRRRSAYPLFLLRAIALLLALALGAVIVVLITKYDNRLTAWAVNILRQSKPPTRASAIGLSTAPRLSSVFNPEASLDRTLLIDGPQGERHVRVLAFDTYDETVWRPALSARTFQKIPRQLSSVQPTTAPAQTLRITRLGDTFDLLPIPSSAVALRAQGDLAREPLDALRDSGVHVGTPYEVTVAPGSAIEFVALTSPPDAAQRRRALAVPPEIDPKVVDLAKSVAGDAPAPLKIFRLQQHLRSNHAYSLTYTPATPGDPLNDFVIHRRAAHCQYFASALVIMARAAGVPARMVTGYYAHEPYGRDRTVVRERDAHAWAECYLDDVGQWVTVDATPPAGRPDGLFPDPPAWRRWLERLRDFPGQLRAWFANLPRHHLVTLIALAATAALLIALTRALLTRRHRRRATDPDAYPAPDAQLLDIARRFDHWLRTTGHPVPPSSTWREHARTLTPTHPQVLDFLNTYDAARFGPLTPNLLPHLRATLAHLEQSPPQHPPPASS